MLGELFYEIICNSKVVSDLVTAKISAVESVVCENRLKKKLISKSLARSSIEKVLLAFITSGDFLFYSVLYNEVKDVKTDSLKG